MLHGISEKYALALAENLKQKRHGFHGFSKIWLGWEYTFVVYRLRRRVSLPKAMPQLQAETNAEKRRGREAALEALILCSGVVISCLWGDKIIIEDIFGGLGNGHA
jgi:hypothetical protein